MTSTPTLPRAHRIGFSARKQGLGLLLASVCAWATTVSLAQAQTTAPSPPIVIKRGGTYTGNWESTNPDVAAVTVDTTEPVVIRKCTLAGRGHLIRSLKVGTDITIADCRATGRPPQRVGSPYGRFVAVVRPNRLAIENNQLTSTAGIYVDGLGGAANYISIQRNRVTNIEGRLSNGGVGFTSEVAYMQFVQLNNLWQSANVTVAWNEVLNEPGRSRVEDVISIHRSSGTTLKPISISNNFIMGAYPARPDVDGYSGGGILVDGSALSASRVTGNVLINQNQVLATTNHGISIAAGSAVTISDNRVISTGLLPDGKVIKGANIGMYVWDYYGDRAKGYPFRDHRVTNNRVAWWNSAGIRNDWWFPDCQQSICTPNQSLPLARDNRIYLDEQASWRAKLLASAVTIGPR